MKSQIRRVGCCLAIFPVLVLAPAIGTAAAQSARAFYEGKQVRVIVGLPPGGGYDIYARAIAGHMPKHLPGNPSVIVQNMPGAGSVVAANYLYKIARPDGLTVGTFSRALPFGQLAGITGIAFDARKFNWLGSSTQAVSFCAVRADTGVKTLEQVIGSPKPVIMGASSLGADMAQFALALNTAVGTNFKIILGYGGMAPILVAVERGEVEAFCGSWDTVKLIKPDWFRGGYVNVLVQLAMEGHPELRNVPLALQYAKTDKQRRFLEIVLSRQIMANPYAAPPGVPPDRLAALRQAFMRTLQDPEFLAMAEKMKLEINPVSGEVIQKLVERIFAPDPEVMKMLEVFKE